MKFRLPFRRALLGVALCGSCLAPATAQTPGVAASNDAARDLSIHLNTLASDGQNLRALIGAGEAALLLGDPNAAIGFFGRAEEIDPRNARIKAGLGRALLLLEQPRDALRLFDSATDLGFPEAEIAFDRGLAYDLRGDQRRAQRDYALAAKRGGSDELTRRHALSLGISGDREQAVALLDPLLRKQDKAAWRAQAFILAMNGDTAGANGIARVVMPAYLAAPMEPFLARLGGLSDSQKAMAVHFGHMPSDGRSHAAADTTASMPGALTPASGAIVQPIPEADAKRVTAAPSREPRRRPGTAPATAASAANQAIAARETALSATPAPQPATTNTPTRTARVESRLDTRIGPPAPTAATQAALAAATPIATDLRALPPPSSAPTPSPTPPPATASTANAAVLAAASPPPAEERSLAAIIGGLELEKPTIVAPPVPRLTASIPRVAAATPGIAEAAPAKAEPRKPEPKKPEPKKPDPKTQHPARHWAQVATGADKAALARDFDKMAKKTPDLFKGIQPWTVPFKATRRLLAGPFDTAKKAQDFVARMSRAGISGFAWTSPAGQEIEKLSSR